MLRRSEADGLRRLLTDHSRAVTVRLRRDFSGALSEADLEEAMSRASLRAWNAAERFDASKGSLRAWLLVIARRCALRLLESRRRDGLLFAGDLDRRPAVGERSVAVTAASGLQVDLHRCIAHLPPLQRAVLQADLDADGVAAAGPLAATHNTTTNSIYVSRQKARKSVRAALAALGYCIALSHGSARQPRAEQGRTGNKECEGEVQEG